LTRRATFGDFLGAVHQHLGPPASLRAAAEQSGYVAEIRHSLLRLAIVMHRYVQDARDEPDRLPGRARLLVGWDRAGAEASDALAQAAAVLHGDSAGRRQLGARAGSDLAERLDAATVSLIYGRDLLQTHLARGPDGERQHRSEWGAVLTSPPLSWALLGEMAALARQLQPLRGGLERSRLAQGNPEALRRLSAACHWLQVMDNSVQAAERQHPVSAADRALLQALPVNERPPRRLPNLNEPVRGLCEGVIATAERARHAAWLSASEPGWSPAVTATSLRWVPAASTVTSHHCEILLRSLADGTQQSAGDVRAELLQAADAAAFARTRWLALARALDHVTTDTRGQLSPAAIEAGDLALWTGRLAYSDPEWTLASGPDREKRPAMSLTPTPDSVADIVTAVHRGCESLTHLAQGGRKQFRAAAHAGRILVATRSAAKLRRTARPFEAASADRINAVLTLYEYTVRASAEAEEQVSHVRISAQVPQRSVLALTEVRPGSAPTSAEASEGAGQRNDVDAAGRLGTIARTLRALGVTDIELLERGAEIDLAGEQLIVEATTAVRGGVARSTRGGCEALEAEP
jgi:hypothetical protein